MAPPELLENLNPVQREAVTHPGGPLLIVAGAGSGKTRVLTSRVAWLIRDQNVSPFEILAITFTNKAADEMKGRVAALVGPVARKMWVSTFHSACVRILRRDGHHLGYSSSFTIYDQADAERLTGYVLRDENLDTKRFPPRSVHATISAAKNDLVSVDEYSDRARGPFEKRIAQVYREYQRRLVDANAMDFDDLLVRSVELLRAQPQVLAYYQNRFRHVLVDEYQDTNRAQNELVVQLARTHRNICVVGDSDQSVYRFRGADIRNILEFEEKFPDATVIVLEQNYRSTSTILDAANAVIANNAMRRPKALWTEQVGGELIRRYFAEDEHDESAWVCREMQRLHEHENERWGDMAVFYRTNAMSRVLEEQLVRLKIPYRVVGGTRFYDRREVKDALAYLRAVVNPNDEVSVKRVINVPKRGVGDTSVARLDAWATKHGRPFVDALAKAEEAGVGGRALAGINRLVGPARRAPGPEPLALRHARGRPRSHRLPRGAAGRRRGGGQRPAGEPGRAGRRGPGVRADGGGRGAGGLGRRVPGDGEPGGRRRPDPRRQLQRRSHDAPHRQGPGVPGRVPHRAGGRGLPPPAVAGRARRAGGGAPALLRRDHPGPGAAVPDARVEPVAVRVDPVQPAQPVPQGDPRAAHGAGGGEPAAGGRPARGCRGGGTASSTTPPGPRRPPGRFAPPAPSAWASGWATTSSTASSARAWCWR